MSGIKRSKPSILFMGTPDFAVSALTALYDEGYPIVGAVTQPDKPKGRGYELTPPPVKVFAESKGIPVFQPVTLKDGALLDLLGRLLPDFIIVAAYGKILPRYILDFPPLGCVNIHASLLPKYRGAAPIQRAIMDGERVTGITTMMMDAGLDTGDILERAEIPITDTDDFESVHDKLAALGAKLIISTVEKLTAKSLVPQKQDDALATYAPKIEKPDCRLDFKRSARELDFQIRALSPIPLAFCDNNGRVIKVITSVITAHPTAQPSAHPPGTVISTDGGTIAVSCGGGGVLEITRLLPQGKKPMSAADFINGRGIKAGDVLS